MKEEKRTFGSSVSPGKELATRLAQSGVRFDNITGAVSVPIYPAATYAHPGPDESTGYDYSRTKNPTRQALEESLADLEGGVGAYAFSSGMAALTSIFLLFNKGSHLIVGEDLYGGTYRLLEKIFSNFGLEATYLDTTNIENIKLAIQPNTRAILLETPGNPLLKSSNIFEIASLSKERGFITIIDNTFLTFYLQRPLELGADLVVYSATKYLGGHNDLLAGVVVAKDQELSEKVAFIQNSTGPVLSPHDSWLLIRGLKTLALRLDRQQFNADKIASWLENHPLVEKVYFPGLNAEQGYPENQAQGPGAMVSFTVQLPALARHILKELKIISFAESLGGVETLITYPYTQTHADVPEEVRLRLGINDKLLRLSVGIEDYRDLQEDLAQAMKTY